MSQDKHQFIGIARAIQQDANKLGMGAPASTDDELHAIYQVLEKHGITVDQVDMDDQGRNLYRWVVRYGGATQPGAEYWRTPAQALDAALTWLFDGEETPAVEAQ